MKWETAESELCVNAATGRGRRGIYRNALPRASGNRRDIPAEVGRRLLNALAELEADIGGELHRGAEILAGGGQHVGDPGLVIDHEQLAEQRHFLAELGDRTVDHLGDDVGRL